ncbi:MAG: carboxylesterase/lipase family protein [Clostridiales bacterium]|nr:carboxylesterase/lipase family protein [Clostridiales bacterium]
MAKPEALANTKAGKLRGTYIDGVYRFLGVHYAAPPTGELRFLPPQPLIQWVGEKLAQRHEEKCWQTDEPRMEDKEITTTKYFVSQQKLMTGSSDMGVGPQTEDCLALDLWTSGLHDGRKRPVMVWLHGGGNIAGDASANWHDGYNLAKKQDVVSISIGHRLNILGYLYLAGFGNEKYKDSVNIGHQDMVAALRWVHDNIEEFGGDPENVTIFGQSGGAEKVVALMAMPSARGLFHKAIIQSGGFQLSPPEEGIKAAKEFMECLNIDADHLDELQKIPPEDLIAHLRAINKTRTRGTYLRFPIIADGTVIKYDPFDGAEGTELNKDVPIIAGFCKDDLRLFSVANPAYFKYTFEELPGYIEKYGYTGEQAKKIIDIYTHMLSGEPSPCDIYVAFLNDQRFLEMMQRWYQARAKVGCAQMYSYVFCFVGPDPDLKAIHGVDVPFFFDTAIYAPGIWTIDTRVGAMKLSEDASAAWAAFARTGNPSHPGIPSWKPYDETNRYSMLLNVESELVSDYRSEGRKVV